MEEVLQIYYKNSAETARRQQINAQANLRLLKRSETVNNSCDVITVASNEGPYIAEFIHHYIYQSINNYLKNK